MYRYLSTDFEAKTKTKQIRSGTRERGGDGEEGTEIKMDETGKRKIMPTGESERSRLPFL